MFHRIVLVAALLMPTPALSADVTITLNDAEQKIFISMLDAALKNGGLANMQPVVQMLNKLQKAQMPEMKKPPEQAKP